MNHPWKIGLDGVLWVSMESRFYRGVDVVCEPDLIFFNGRGYVVEYKATDKHIGTARGQLGVASVFVAEYLGFVPSLWFVYGDEPYGVVKFKDF